MPDLQQILLTLIAHVATFDLARRLIIAFGLAVQHAYESVRQPHWAKTWGEVRVPYGKWVVAGIVAIVVVFLAIVISRDPLAPHG